MPSLQKGKVNKSEIRILLDNGQIEEALYLLRSDPSKRKDLEQIRFEEDYITRIRVLGMLQELGELVTME